MNAHVEPSSAVRRESAEFHLLKKILLARPETTCGEAVALFRQQQLDYADAAVVIDSQLRVIGMISTGKLVTEDANTPLGRVMQRDVPIATLDTDQERVASLAIDSVLGAVPIVDRNGCFVGLITPQALLSVLRREHVEDLHRLTGILVETNSARAAIEGPPLSRARHRLPWLFVGLAGSALAAVIMAQYEAVLKARVEIAFFLPGVVYLADAIGTQTEAVAVRGLSLSHLSIRQLLGRELWTGVTMGACLGTVAALALWAFLQDLPLALAIGMALFASGTIAAAIGLVLPWLFHRFGFDPAYGSGPLGTVAQDVLSVLLYFVCITTVLGAPH